ncbi:MAG: 50S ribosomal protein L24 [Chloroflexi bacterium]|nr:50S ribosomal protein L24 [Chloroflexota bacterium]
MRKIKKGDTVEVISGDDRWMRGTVRRLVPEKDRVVVAGINLVKKHQRPRPTGGRTQTQAGIIEFEAPFHLSNVMLVCPQCNQRTRVAFEFSEDGSKVRVCKKCDSVID